MKYIGIPHVTIFHPKEKIWDSKLNRMTLNERPSYVGLKSLLTRNDINISYKHSLCILSSVLLMVSTLTLGIQSL